jgi:hypothetical protein|tara:strand:- start:258 stop:662 length:405 start_codon:yes stop_codon:yes gene_type:complete
MKELKMQKTVEENKDLLKFNAEGIKPADMFLNARKVAVKAVDDYMKDKEEPLYCGFASVSIHPARGKFVKFMKNAGIGDNGYRGGYRISYYDIMPQDHRYRTTQSLDIKEVATEAFRDELRKYGMTVYADSRAD